LTIIHNDSCLILKNLDSLLPISGPARLFSIKNAEIKRKKYQKLKAIGISFATEGRTVYFDVSKANEFCGR